MKIEILSLFPEFFKGPFSESMIRRAQERGIVSIDQIDIRNFAFDRHKSVDDKPYGGGAGMLLKPEPLLKALASVRKEDSYVVYVSPRGVPFSTKRAQQLAEKKHLILIAGHYEGIDERVLQEVDEEISIGDYILTNGCVASIVVVDALVRFVPDVLGDLRSAEEESFTRGLLEHGHYTRPATFEGQSVPNVLLEGDHAKIARWRREDALKKTLENREDLYLRYLGRERDAKGALILVVRDLVESVRFYKKFFGLTLEQCDEERARFQLEQGQRLILVEGSRTASTYGALYQMVLRDGLEYKRIRERLAKAAPFFDGAEEETIYCRDLDGHLWMIYYNTEEK